MALLLSLSRQEALPLSLDISHENASQLINDRLDTAADDRRFYENFSIDLSNPGTTDLSCVADLNVTNFYAPASGSRLDIGSLYLDWQKLLGNVGLTAGRQFLSEFTATPSYFDGVVLHYNGTLLSTRAYGGMRIPSRFVSTPVEFNGKAAEAGFWADLRPHRTTVVGIGAHEEQDENGNRELRLAASLKSHVNRYADISSVFRYETSHKSLEYYSVRLRSSPLKMLSLELYGLGQSWALDSLNFYRRMFLTRFNEAGGRAGLHLSNDAFLYLDYAKRFFAKGNDNDLDATVWFKGASLRFGSVEGVSGKSRRLVPAYTLRLHEVAEISASASFWHYEADSTGSIMRDAAAYTLEGRWFVPLRRTGLNLVVEPRLEYLTNTYYSRDIRLWLFTRLSFSAFWKSSPLESDKGK